MAGHHLDFFSCLSFWKKGRGTCRQTLGHPCCPGMRCAGSQRHLTTTFLGPSPCERPRRSPTPRIRTSAACNTNVLRASPETLVGHPTPASFFFSQRLGDTQFYMSFPTLRQPLISLTHLSVNNAQVTQRSAGNPRLRCSC